MKKCGSCGVEKSLDCFSKNKLGQFGRHSTCKSCRKKKSAQFYSDNKDMVLERTKQWQANNYDKHKENVKTWRSKNVFKVRHYLAKFRCKNLGMSEHFSALELYEVFYTQAGLCACCGKDLDEFHVDHKTPISKGGANVIENIQILCPSCNLSKKNMLPMDWEEKRKLEK